MIVLILIGVTWLTLSVALGLLVGGIIRAADEHKARNRHTPDV
jgi:hypothetical protein